MSKVVEIKVPDIGDFSGVDIIEVLVSVGDAIDAEQGLLTLETDKASMEVPSPMSGTVKELKVALGEKVSQGDLILMLELADQAQVGAQDPTRYSAHIPNPPTLSSHPNPLGGVPFVNIYKVSIKRNAAQWIGMGREGGGIGNVGAGTCSCACTCACKCSTSTCTCAGTCACVFVCLCDCTGTCACTCACTCAFAYTSAGTYACACTCVSTRACACARTCA